MNKLLKEGKAYKTWVLPIGVPSFSSTGKTKYGWSIYDHPTTNIYLSDRGIILYSSTLEVNKDDVLNLYDNDSQRYIIGGIHIIDSSPSNKEDVLKMLKRNGYDYYPLAPYQKKRRERDIWQGYSIKGYDNEKNTELYNKMLNDISYTVTSNMKHYKELTQKNIGYDLKKWVGQNVGDDSNESIKLFLDYANSDEGKKYLLKQALSKISEVIHRLDDEYENNQSQLKIDRDALRDLVKKEINRIYENGGFLENTIKESKNMKKSELVQLIENTVRRVLKETGEMSRSDIQPGGEYYEWAKQIKLTALNLAKNSNGKVRFVEVKPFDKYQGPYAVLKIDENYDELWMVDNLFYIKNLNYAGPLSLLIKAIKSDFDSIRRVKMIAKDLSENKYYNRRKRLVENVNRPIYEIAQEIKNDWKNMSYYAKPYLDAMFDLDKITDKYYADSGSGIVAYFLGNANSWRGEKAKAIKAELNSMLKNYYKGR